MKTYTLLFDTGIYYGSKRLSMDPKIAWKEFRRYQRLYGWKRCVMLIHGYYKAVKYNGEKGAYWYELGKRD